MSKIHFFEFGAWGLGVRVCGLGMCSWGSLQKGTERESAALLDPQLNMAVLAALLQNHSAKSLVHDSWQDSKNNSKTWSEAIVDPYYV